MAIISIKPFWGLLHLVFKVLERVAYEENHPAIGTLLGCGTEHKPAFWGRFFFQVVGWASLCMCAGNPPDEADGVLEGLVRLCARKVDARLFKTFLLPFYISVIWCLELWAAWFRAEGC